MILLSVEVKNHLQVRVCAYYRHIDVYTWNPYLHTCNPNLLTSGSLSLSTSIAAATATATIAVAATAAAPAAAAATILLPGASFPPLLSLPLFLLLVVDCCLPRRGLLLCFRHTRDPIHAHRRLEKNCRRCPPH